MEGSIERYFPSFLWWVLQNHSSLASDFKSNIYRTSLAPNGRPITGRGVNPCVKRTKQYWNPKQSQERAVPESQPMPRHTLRYRAKGEFKNSPVFFRLITYI